MWTLKDVDTLLVFINFMVHSCISVEFSSPSPPLDVVGTLDGDGIKNAARLLSFSQLLLAEEVKRNSMEGRNTKNTFILSARRHKNRVIKCNKSRIKKY